MKKSDLKDFMVVQLDVRNYERENEDMYLVIGNTLVTGVGYMNLRSYDENMEHIDKDKFLDNSIGTYSIVKVFKIKDIGKGIEFFFNEDNLELIWERKKEIDWNKVPFGTKVVASDFEERLNRKYIFVGYKEELEKYPFIVARVLEGEAVSFRYCKIHPDVDIKEEWYK
ncbi:hypothetical protein [Clostridium perfringens]|uniref:hypothetical protein n=1 Tax=Clostridium perfringens TaxID=1502 RepID=UPI0023F6AC23|nr:hypothetical protein [Clostridium perfringens]WEV22568.1 hypothetical protein PL327_02555 [Clostridium perfringens D]